MNSCAIRCTTTILSNLDLQLRMNSPSKNEITYQVGRDRRGRIANTKIVLQFAIFHAWYECRRSRHADHKNVVALDCDCLHSRSRTQTSGHDSQHISGPLWQRLTSGTLGPSKGPFLRVAAAIADAYDKKPAVGICKAGDVLSDRFRGFPGIVELSSVLEVHMQTLAPYSYQLSQIAFLEFFSFEHLDKNSSSNGIAHA